MRKQPVHPLGAERWGFTVILGLLSTVILLLILFFLLLSGTFGLTRVLVAVIPQGVRDFFTTAQPVDLDTAELKKTRAVLAKRLEQLRDELKQRGTSAPKAFTLGSPKDEVLLVQGPPTEATPGVWKYGTSEVYFVQDRVASWSNTPENPLKIR
jgi:hypothetical protein